MRSQTLQTRSTTCDEHLSVCCKAFYSNICMSATSPDGEKVCVCREASLASRDVFIVYSRSPMHCVDATVVPRRVHTCVRCNVIRRHNHVYNSARYCGRARAAIVRPSAVSGWRLPAAHIVYWGDICTDAMQVPRRV